MTTPTTRPDTPPPATHGLLELLRLLPAEVRYRRLLTPEAQAEAKALLPAWQAYHRPADPQWIAKRVQGLLAHWRSPELTETELKFVARDWTLALGDYPARIIDAACVGYVRRGKFRPTPADIVALCEELGEEVRMTRRMAELAAMPPALPAPREVPITPQEREQCRAALANLRMNLTKESVA